MEKNNILNKILDRTPRWLKIYHRISMDLSQYINELINDSGKQQNEIATVLGKHESEISKWLSGNHNFTLKSIAKLEDALGERIILVPSELESYYFKPENTLTTKVIAKKQICVFHKFESKTHIADYSASLSQKASEPLHTEMETLRYGT